jgi:hypothetical protein
LCLISTLPTEKKTKCQQIVSKTLHFLLLSLNKVTSGFFLIFSILKNETLESKIKNQFSVFGSSNWDWGSGWERCDYTDWHSFAGSYSPRGAWLHRFCALASLPPYYHTLPFPIPSLPCENREINTFAETNLLTVCFFRVGDLRRGRARVCCLSLFSV